MDIGVDEPDLPARCLYESFDFTNRTAGPDGPLCSHASLDVHASQDRFVKGALGVDLTCTWPPGVISAAAKEFFARAIRAPSSWHPRRRFWMQACLERPLAIVIHPPSSPSLANLRWLACTGIDSAPDEAFVVLLAVRSPSDGQHTKRRPP